MNWINKINQNQIPIYFDDYQIKEQFTASLPKPNQNKIDTFQNESGYGVSIFLPNYDKHELKVEVKNNVMWVTANKNNISYPILQFILQNNVDCNRIKANFEDKKLQIFIPKMFKDREINID